MKPFFIDGRQGRLFCLLHEPDAPRDVTGVLLLAPFAEEMNKSRRMFSLLGRELAAKGYPVMQFDYFGTGESEGDFGDATWSLWQQDLERALDWFAGTGIGRVSVVALRAGALLVPELLRNHAVPIDKLILWQPVANGETFLNQFYRLKLAADMTGDPGSRTTIKDIRWALEAGEAVEIAGYTLNPGLASGMSKARLADLTQSDPRPIHWFELVSMPERPLLPVSKNAITILEDAGFAVRATTLQGPQFWSTVEISDCPELLEMTLGALDGQ